MLSKLFSRKNDERRNTISSSVHRNRNSHQLTSFAGGHFTYLPITLTSCDFFWLLDHHYFCFLDILNISWANVYAFQDSCQVLKKQCYVCPIEASRSSETRCLRLSYRQTWVPFQKTWWTSQPQALHTLPRSDENFVCGLQSRCTRIFLVPTSSRLPCQDSSIQWLVLT